MFNIAASSIVCFFYLLSTANCTQFATDSSAIQILKNHVKYLASDELQGRGSGTEGNDAAAKYVAQFFKQNGISPLGSTYFQEFTVPVGYTIKPATTMKFAVKMVPQGVNPESVKSTMMSWKLGADYTPLGFSDNGKISSELVFVGYGISNSTANYDDYSGIHVKGKTVIVIRGTPEKKVDPHGSFTQFASLRAKAALAKEKGAAAIVFISQPSDSSEWLLPLKYETGNDNSGIIAVHATRTSVDRLFPREKKVPSLEKVIASTQKPNSFILPNILCNIETALEPNYRPTSNVIGIVPGTDPSKKNQYIVVGAHFDHLGLGEFGSLYSGKKTMIHYGADDNASGTAAMMEIAAYFAKHPLPRPVIAMGFSGEEIGLLGSSHYVKNPLVPNDSIAAMINLDMVGRLKDNKINVQGVGTSTHWGGLVDSLELLHGFTISKGEDGFGPSDHSSFYAKNRPVLFIFTGLHSDYHKPTDVWEKINFSGINQIKEFTVDIIENIGLASTLPPFQKAKESVDKNKPMRFSVSLGIVPDYGENPKGLKVTAVKEIGPAATAGLQADDIIIQLGETTIKNIYDYTLALGKFKSGDKAKIVVLRGPKEDKEYTAEVVFEARSGQQ